MYIHQTEREFFYFNGDIKHVTLSTSTYFSHIFQFHNTLRKHVTQLKFSQIFGEVSSQIVRKIELNRISKDFGYLRYLNEYNLLL